MTDEKNPPAEVLLDEKLNESLNHIMLAALTEGMDQDLSPPKTLPLFPITKQPLFPGMTIPLFVKRGAFYKTLQKVARSSRKRIALVLIRDERKDLSELESADYHAVGVIGHIVQIQAETRDDEEGAHLLIAVEQRCKVIEILPRPDGYAARVALYPQDESVGLDDHPLLMHLTALLKEISRHSPIFKEDLQTCLSHADFTPPGRLADYAASLTHASREELQAVLEMISTRERIDFVVKLLETELALCRFQEEMRQKTETTLQKHQKEYYIREQIKLLKQEISGEEGGKQAEKNKFEARLATRTLTDEAAQVVREELDKLSVIEPASPEYTICRNYLDWLTILPWGIRDQNQFNIAHARRVLNNDHYGLDEVKQRILEIIGIAAFKSEISGNILCLIGPPGVGKTSIGKSIAHALGRKFYRFSVGGMQDEAEIKGHRRTYIGAMPGKFLQALKRTGTINPVIMIDEVDKIGKSFHGDPASSLLEALDPEQNKEFLDHYLDVRVDLSEVLFILTANVLDDIPEPLLDRMEVIRLPGYTPFEKLQIAQHFLIPKYQKEYALSKASIRFSPQILEEMIRGYAREAGVRQLENCIKKILRKVIFEWVESYPEQIPSIAKKKRITLSSKEIARYLGKPKFTSDQIYPVTPVGVSTGLAWTSHGGAVLYIETLKVPNEKIDMKLTGQAGDVMKESAQIAWTYLHSAFRNYAPTLSFFDGQVHMHIPEGATPKDGPSAGITMTTALLSLLMGVPVREGLGMTGEITLTGKILPVGGIREKVVAGCRSNLQLLLLPKENQRDYDEIPEMIRHQIEVRFVEHYDEVFRIAFP